MRTSNVLGFFFHAKVIYALKPYLSLPYRPRNCETHIYFNETLLIIGDIECRLISADIAKIDL